MTANDRGNTPTRAERRDVTTRAGGIWTDAERDRFIAELREARRDAHAVTIQGDIVQKPAPNPSDRHQAPTGRAATRSAARRPAEPRAGRRASAQHGPLHIAAGRLETDGRSKVRRCVTPSGRFVVALNIERLNPDSREWEASVTAIVEQPTNAPIDDADALGAKYRGSSANATIEAAAAAVDATLLGKARQIVATCDWCQARTAIEYRVARGRPVLQRVRCGRCGQAVEFQVSGEINAIRSLPDG